ncbi:MAG: hypothetical protein IKZ88_08360 [Neisseriaceae bacterium]|nr:hypothetical protein [Neisseriaceae bacterium]
MNKKVGWAFLPTITAETLSGCLKQYSAVILCSAVMMGWEAHPTTKPAVLRWGACPPYGVIEM